MKKIIFFACFLSGCSSIQAPYHFSDSGRMAMLCRRDAKPMRSEFEVVFASGPVASYTACAMVEVSTDGVKSIIPCSDN